MWNMKLRWFGIRHVAVLFTALGILLGIECARAQRPLGIDVSDYQGTSINWTSVKGAGYVFAWTKATEGASGQYVSQASFTLNESNGKTAGVYMGAYHYAHPERNTPAAEASYFWSVAGNYIKTDGLTLVPMLDIEGSAFSGHVGANSLSEWINLWCSNIVQNAANAGTVTKPAIYISACNAGNLDGTVAQWPSDIANYGSVNGGNNPQTGTPWSACAGNDVWAPQVYPLRQTVRAHVTAKSRTFDVEHRHKGQAIGYDVVPSDAPEVARLSRRRVAFRMSVVIGTHVNAGRFAIAFIKGKACLADVLAGSPLRSLGPGENVASAFHARPIDACPLIVRNVDS